MSEKTQTVEEAKAVHAEGERRREVTDAIYSRMSTWAKSHDSFMDIQGRDHFDDVAKDLTDLFFETFDGKNDPRLPRDPMVLNEVIVEQAKRLEVQLKRNETGERHAEIFLAFANGDEARLISGKAHMSQDVGAGKMTIIIQL